jgi:hypothetical protein
MDNPDIKIFSFHYKPGPVVECESIYIPVFAGKKSSIETSEMTGDDSGDNISVKNKYYSELTGIIGYGKTNMRTSLELAITDGFSPVKKSPSPTKSNVYFTSLSDYTESGMA